LTKKELLFDFALDLLENILKTAYISKKKHDFYWAANYCISISIVFGIELEIDELLDENYIQASENVYKMVHQNIVENELFIINKTKLPLQILLQIRKGLINKNNYSKYVQNFSDNYNVTHSNEYLVAISIISYLVGKKNNLDIMSDEISKLPRSSINYKITDLMYKSMPDDKVPNQRDIISLIKSIKSKTRVDLGIIYYFLIHEKTKHYFN